MYLIKDQNIIPIDAKEIVLQQGIEDVRIQEIEQIVSGFYGINVSELDVYYRDTDAKLMCCFLLHHLLNYSIGSISKKYRVFPLFLKNKIQEHYQKCLQDSVFMAQVTELKDAFLYKKPLSNSVQMK